ncbi:MAG: stage V sporulation protein AE [Bacilli bacterium]|nr:stage V sporulation protein AE [Bacilli bacterium]
MIYINAFLFCGFICLISQLILDNTKLTPGHITSLFVVIGASLDLFGIYDKFVLYCGAGAIIPITSFGHLLVHGAMDTANDIGPLGLSFGIFNLTSAGISVALVMGFLMSVLFKPKH